MADPLSITASILAVVGAGFKASKGLYQLADGIGSAGMEARVYAEEIDSFSKLLQRIREQITQRSEQISSFEESLLRDIIDVCDRVMRPINGIQERLNPILVRFRSSPSKLRSFGLRVQWMFSSKDRLLFYRGALRGQHRLLDTTLELMILQSTKDRSPQNIYFLQISLENSVAGIKHALNGPRQLTTANGESSRLPNLRITSPPDDGEEDENNNNNAENHQIKVLQHQPMGHEEPSSTALVPSSSMFDEEETLAEGVLEEEFDNSAQDLLEDMRVVSRKVLRYASDVLRSTGDETTTTSGSDVKHQKLPTAETEAALSDERPAVPIFEASDVEIHPAETAPVASPVGSVSAAHTPAVSIRNKRSSSRKPNRDTQGVELVEPRIWGKKENMLAGNIFFKHAEEESYVIPFDEVQTWEGMEKFLNSIYPPFDPKSYAWTKEEQQSKLRSEAINAGAFTLMGPQKQRVKPQYWGKLVEPGWEVELLFHDSKLNVNSAQVQLNANSTQAQLEEAKRKIENEKALIDLEKQRMDMDDEVDRIRSKRRVKHAGIMQRLKWALSGK